MMLIKKFIPNSLFGRFLLIITVPTIIVQIVAIYVFYYSHVDTISKHMARGLVSEMSFLKDALPNKGNKKLIAKFSENIDIKFNFAAGKKLTKKAKIISEDYEPVKFGFFNPLPLFDPLNRFKLELVNYGLTPFAIYKYKSDNAWLVVKVETSDGLLNFLVPTKRITSSTKTVFTTWMIGTSILTSLIAIIFIKNQIRSIKGLSLAAEKFGRGGEVPDFKPSGAREIRSVGISFIRMKERIMRQITQRTYMLSGVSHDLRTPLTRMKLQLEMMGSSESIDELKTDIADMEKMINEYLEFAKGGEQEKNKEIAINNFLKNTVTYYQKMGKEIGSEINIDEKLKMGIKPLALTRAIRNLIDNALNYGQKAVMGAKISDDNLLISISDDGPGVPKEERENIFKPFYRIDNSRNLDKTGAGLGAGLGLAIAMDIISSHGGKIKASDSSFGGLCVTIYLPL